jgi:hypothetical protein
MHEFADEYLSALKLKERQLAGIRIYLRRLEEQRQDRQPAYQLLRDMLSDVEPRCHEIIHVMTRLRSGKSAPSENSRLEAKHHPHSAVPTETDESMWSQVHADHIQSIAGQQSASVTEPATAEQTGDVRQQIQALVVSETPVTLSDGCHDSGAIVQPVDNLVPNPNQASSRVETGRVEQLTNQPQMTVHVERHRGETSVPARQPVPAERASRRPDSGRSSDSLGQKLHQQRKLGEASVKCSISDWIEKVKETKKDGETKWRIDRKRSDYLQSVSEKYENAREYELRRDLMVIFEGEEAIDRGALTKEFFYLSFETAITGHFKDCKLMIGERGHLLPDATTDHLVHAFKFLGMMLAHAVKSGCRGMPGLSPAIVHYLIHGSSLAFIEDLQPPVTIDDVADKELRTLLTELDSGTNLTETEQQLLREWMDRSNCRVALNAGTRMLVIQTVLIYYVFKMRVRQIDALAEGMEIFDLRGFLRNNPSNENIAIVFPSPDDIKITPEMFKAVMIARGSEFDPRTLDFFENYLQDLHSGNIAKWTIADLLCFMTGTPYLPHQIVFSFNKSNGLPVAHACFNEIELPMNHGDYGSFRDAMTKALEAPLEFSMS